MNREWICLSFFRSLSNSPFSFAVCALQFMVCQKSAMHEKLPPPPAPASRFSTLSFWIGSASTWASALWSAKQGDSSYEDRQKADLARGQWHALQTDSMGHWAEGIRHGWIKREITHRGQRSARQKHTSDELKKTEPQATKPNLPHPYLLFYLHTISSFTLHIRLLKWCYLREALFYTPL